MSVDSQARSTHALFRIVGLSTGLAFGGMVGTLFAVKAGPEGITFHVTPPAVIAFLLSGTIAWFYWQLVERMAAGPAPDQRRKRFKLFSIGLVVVGIISFLYPLKFIPEEKRRDVFIGLTLAIGCITGVGFVMMKVKRFLEADQQQAEEQEQK